MLQTTTLDAQSWNLHISKLIPDQTVWNFLQLIMTDHTLTAGNPLKLTEYTHLEYLKKSNTRPITEP